MERHYADGESERVKTSQGQQGNVDESIHLLKMENDLLGREGSS